MVQTVNVMIDRKISNKSYKTNVEKTGDSVGWQFENLAVPDSDSSGISEMEMTLRVLHAV